MDRRLLTGLAGCLVLAGVLFAVSARAEDPHEMPAAPKIESPLLKAAVGEWQVSWTATTPDGAQSGTSTSRFALAIGDTGLVEDYSSPEMIPGTGFYGHGVARVADGGKTLRLWWFDSMGAEPVELRGPLTDTQSTIEGDTPMGHMKIVWKKVEGGFDFEGTLDGSPWLSQQYRAKK
jgi:hypothetical protein